jgi:D-alanyl-D-alanine carboxypeptidase
MPRLTARPLSAAGVALALAALLVGCGADPDEPSPSGRLTTSSASPSASPTQTEADASAVAPTDAESLLDYLEQHADQTGLVIRRAGDPEPLVADSSDEPRSLASTRKILLLLAVAEDVAAGTLDPAEQVAIEDVERWYAPGTDGGAHDAAVAELGPDWTVQTVAQAMIIYSDNAATDWLLDRVGGSAAVDEVIDAYGMTSQDPLWVTLGEYLAWELEPEALLAASPAERVGIAERLAQAHPAGPVEVTLPPVEDQRDLAAVSTRGTAGEWAALMDAVATEAEAGDPAAAYTVEVLSWPLAVGDNAEKYTLFASKGGSLPGVITEADVIQPKGGERLTVVQLYGDLAPDAESAIAADFVHQQLLVRLAEDPAFLAEVADRLGGDS